jgi:hypothetical protein
MVPDYLLTMAHRPYEPHQICEFHIGIGAADAS